MKATKAYILRIKNPISIEYAKIAAESCDKVGLEWQYFDGYSNMTGLSAWKKTGLETKMVIPDVPGPSYIEDPPVITKAECCSAGHAAIWKKIAEGKEDAAIVLEHDAIMLHSMADIDIPDMAICPLGYKMANPYSYRHEQAGPTKTWVDIDGHEGAHAYALTKRSAQFLVGEIKNKGPFGLVDNMYFIRRQRRTALPLKLANPVAALGWLRESTIWEKTAHSNYEFIASFKQHYK